MTLREIVDANPGLFYNQSWYEGEAFTRKDVQVLFLQQPDRVIPYDKRHAFSAPRTRHAVELAHLYTLQPNAEHWNGWLWTCDADSFGHVVYVGKGPSGLFEVHRYFPVSERWGYPVWLEAA